MSDITDFNCECDTSPYETLGELRRRMMVRLGYPAQADNPPPGMSDLLDDFLVGAQKLMYNKEPTLRTKRWFRWTMTPGVRFYGIDDNDDDTESPCPRSLDAYHIDWMGFEDLNEAWYELIAGINPLYYTRTNEIQGWPSNYEVRSCIEIWPAPDGAYKLWALGDFGLESFVNDYDPATIDSELVFLLALGNAKAHYGQRDAPGVLAQANTYLLDVKAGKHTTKRYVPAPRPTWSPPTIPKFLPLVGP